MCSLSQLNVENIVKHVVYMLDCKDLPHWVHNDNKSYGLYGYGHVVMTDIHAPALGPSRQLDVEAPSATASVATR